MKPPVVVIKKVYAGTGYLLAITIDGKQALAEGPVRKDYCVYCSGACCGSSVYCDFQVRLLKGNQ